MGTSGIITWETAFTFKCPVHQGSTIKADVKEDAPRKRTVFIYYKGDRCGCKFRADISDEELHNSSAPFHVLNSIPKRKNQIYNKHS